MPLAGEEMFRVSAGPWLVFPPSPACCAIMIGCASATGLPQRDERVRVAAAAAGERPGQERGDLCATNTTGGCDIEGRVADCGAAPVMEVGPAGPMRRAGNRPVLASHRRRRDRHCGRPGQRCAQAACQRPRARGTSRPVTATRTPQVGANFTSWRSCALPTRPVMRLGCRGGVGLVCAAHGAV